MGTINHHQERSMAFLSRARTAGQAGDIADAAVALRRSVSHAATALAVNAGLCHNTRHRLEIAIHGCVSSGRMSRSHVKTFRQVHTLPEYLASEETRHGKRVGDRGCPLRRLRRRVAALLKDADAIIAGNPRPVRYHKRWARGLPPRFRPEDLPPITSVRDILDLPNYGEIVAEWKLEKVPLMRSADPHGWYERGAVPIRCPCHPETGEISTHRDTRFPLSPIWQKVLERVLGTPIPDVLRA